MTRWQMVRLGDAVELAYGKSLPKNARAEGTVPVYGSNGIAGWHDTALVSEPTIIVGRKGSAGALQYVEQPCYPIDTTYFVRVRERNSFEIKFLYYLLRKLDLSRLKTATGVPGLTREDAYRELIPVPPLVEQRRIVDILSRAEGIMRLRRQAAEKAREIIPALFLEMFGDPATNPKGWKKGRLDQVCKISYGIADKLDTSITAERGIRILTISNILLEGELDLGVMRFCEATESQVMKCSVERGDLLFNWRNGSETHIGKTGIWESDDIVLHVSFLLRLRPLLERVNSYFLWVMLNLLRSRSFFLNVSRQQVNRKFNASELSALELPSPPVELQERFAATIEQSRAIQAQQAVGARKADTTFQALLAQAFSG